MPVAIFRLFDVMFLVHDRSAVFVPEFTVMAVVLVALKYGCFGDSVFDIMFVSFHHISVLGVVVGWSSVASYISPEKNTVSHFIYNMSGL